MKIYSNTDKLILDVPVTDDSYRYYELGVEDYIECEFHLNELVGIPTGARIGYDGEVYTLYIAPQVEKLNDHSYRYTARFEGYMGMLKRYIFHNIPDGRVSFSLTATPAEHLKMILDNMNERDGETSYGKQWRDNDKQCVAADAKTISYDKLNCLEALQLMAAEFETEFEVIRVVKRGFVNDSFVVIDRYYDIVVKKVAYGKDAPLKLSYGKGNGFREDISRVAENESAPVGVMWAKGGDRNINAASYGHTTLQLPAGLYGYADGKLYNELDIHLPANAQLFVVPDGKNYVQRKGSTNAVEACIDCSDIYPHREGEVTKAGVEGNDNAYYAIVDDTIPDDLNYDDYKINGQEPTIVFQSGMLAGKEFRINGYNHTYRKFVIAQQAIDGVYMPSDEFPVTAGDKYAIYGISVPEAFITEASRAMLVKAIEELLRVEQPRYLYTGQIDGIWAKNDWTTKRQNLRVGGYIEYDELGAQNTLLRIEAVKEYLNNPYSLELTFGDRSLKPRYRISTLVSTSESMTISAQESSKQQLINASATTSAASLDKAIIALRGSEKDTAEDLTIYGGRAFAKEQADGVLGTKTDVAGKLTVNGTRNYIDTIFSPIIKGNKSLIGLLFFGGSNVSTDIYVPNYLALFDPSLDFMTRYDVDDNDKVRNPPNYESAYYVKITTSNYTNYIGAVIAIEVDVTSDEFTDAFGYALHAGDWLVASPYGWKKISGSDVGGSNGVDFEEVKNWVETKLESYAKMSTEQPLQDSILIYDSDNQIKGSDVQISTTVQDIEYGENSKIPTCGQVAEFVEGAISQIAPGSGGGITEETDPVFSVSPAADITEAKIIEWDNKVDKVEGKGLSTNDYTEEDKTQIDSVTKKTDSIENKDISEKDDGIIIEDNDGVEVIKITATTETIHRSEQRWESDDGLEVFAKIDEDGIDGKVSRIIPAITMPIVVEPDSDIVDEGYASPIGRNNVIRANWSAENKYTYYDFIAHYYDIYIGVSDGYSVSKKSLGSDASNSGYELFEYDFCPLNYKKVVMISAGMNTCETGALWGLATFIKAIMTSEEEGFKFLRENVRFKIIPMICPSSFDKDTLAYPNSNGVRINKNFDYCRNWYNITDSTKGEYPDSEVESRILKKWLNDNAWEADLYIDCHQDPDKNVSQEKELTVVICSDSATNSKLRECFPALVQFYRDKGYIAPDISPNTYSWVEVGNNYPKTKYAKDICGIPSLMIEQYCSSTMYGSDGNTINDVAGIKNYVTMLRLYTFAILSGGEKVINCGNISRLTK